MKKIINICLAVILVGSFESQTAQSQGLAAVCETSDETLSEILNSKDETLIGFMVAICGREVFDRRVANAPCEACDAKQGSGESSLGSKGLFDDQVKQSSDQVPSGQGGLTTAPEIKAKEPGIVFESEKRSEEKDQSVLGQDVSPKSILPREADKFGVPEALIPQFSVSQPKEGAEQSASRFESHGSGIQEGGDVGSKMEPTRDALQSETSLPLADSSAANKEDKNYLTAYSSIERTIYKMFLETYFGTASTRMSDQRRKAKERGVGVGVSFDIAQPEFLDLDPISLEFSAFTSNRESSSVTNFDSQGRSFRGEITIPLNHSFSIGAGLEYDIARLEDPSVTSVLRQHSKKVFVPITYRTDEVFGQASSIQFSYLLSGDAFIDGPSGDGVSSARFRVKSRGGYGLRFRYAFNDQLQYFIDYWKIRMSHDVDGQNASQESTSTTQWDLTFGLRVQH